MAIGSGKNLVNSADKGELLFHNLPIFDRINSGGTEKTLNLKQELLGQTRLITLRFRCCLCYLHFGFNFNFGVESYIFLNVITNIELKVLLML